MVFPAVCKCQWTQSFHKNQTEDLLGMKGESTLNRNFGSKKSSLADWPQCYEIELLRVVFPAARRVPNGRVYLIIL